MKYWVELGIKHMEKGEKIHILGIFGGLVTVHLESVPVHPSRTECVPVHVRYRYTLFCFPNFNQVLYFGHNFLISYLI